MVRDKIAENAVVEAMFSAPSKMTTAVETRIAVTGIWFLLPRRPSRVEQGVPPSRAKAHKIRDVAVSRPNVASEADTMMVEVIALAAAAFPPVMRLKMCMIGKGPDLRAVSRSPIKNNTGRSMMKPINPLTPTESTMARGTLRAGFGISSDMCVAES